MQAARFTQARLSPGDDMRIDATRAGGDLKIAIRGASIDARPFLKSVTQTSEPDTHRDSDDFDIELKAPILTGFAKQALINADLRVARKAGALKQFAMSGQFGRAPFAATLARGDNGQQGGPVRYRFDCGGGDCGSWGWHDRKSFVDWARVAAQTSAVAPATTFSLAPQDCANTTRRAIS